MLINGAVRLGVVQQCCTITIVREHWHGIRRVAQNTAVVVEGFVRAVQNNMVWYVVFKNKILQGTCCFKIRFGTCCSEKRCVDRQHGGCCSTILFVELKNATSIALLKNTVWQVLLKNMVR